MSAGGDSVIDEGDLRSLLGSLVSIDSVNPDLVPGGAGEGELGEFVGSWLADGGIDVAYEEVAPGRRNVVARLPGGGGGRSLLLNAHLDTVGTASMPGALEARVEGDRLYGRGSQDTKSGLAAAMAVMRAAAGWGLAGDLVLAAVIDEEGDSKGTEALLRTCAADAGIVLEPTGEVIVTVHRGFYWGELETHGVAAHGSDPETGVDAIMGMGHVLVELDRLGEQVRRRPPGPAGAGSMHASLISGGIEGPTYPDRCWLLVERRTVPGETTELVQAEMEAAVESARRRLGPARWTATASLRLARPPLSTSPDARVVGALESACRSVLGSAVLGSAPFWTDAAMMSEAGIESVVFGPKGGGLHSASEWVELGSVRAVADVLAAAVKELCAPSG